MRHARNLYGCLRFIIAGSVLGSFGCTHNYYYGTAPTCVPATPAVVTNGAVCAVPSPVANGGSLVAQGSGRSTIVNGAPIYSDTRPPRVVVSEPSGGRRLGWRRSDPETGGLATTRVEGAYDDPTTNR